MMFAVAARGGVRCTARRALLRLLLLMDDSPLTEPSDSTVARVAVGKSVSTPCQAFVPIHCVLQGGCPWHAATPHSPLRQR